MYHVCVQRCQQSQCEWAVVLDVYYKQVEVQTLPVVILWRARCTIKRAADLTRAQGRGRRHSV